MKAQQRIFLLLFQKRKRRKWIAPNGRTCDSIPKALSMSVEMGLLPPDTVIIHHPKKRGRPPKSPTKKPRIALDLTQPSVNRHSKAYVKRPDGGDEPDEDDEEEEDASDDEDEMEPPTDPEVTLFPKSSHLTTVHWDPNGPMGRKIGWKIRIADDKKGDWKEGRIVRFDPCTHKHKVRFVDDPRSGEVVDSDNCAWIHLRMEDGVQVGSRLVWAHVKGYAWWPAMVMESDFVPPRDGYASVEFFGSMEVATIRDSLESLRPFDHGKVDNHISKNKKKRNASAHALAIEEERNIQQIRNEAARWYAERAWHMANSVGSNWMGKRIMVFRSDVNYPYGDLIPGRVRQYSSHQKKWLVSFEVSETTRKKYDACWINLQNKEHKVRILDKGGKEPGELDIVPYIFGFSELEDPAEEDASLAKALKERCKGCLEHWKKDDIKITCTVCHASFHLGCHDPPLTMEDYQRLDLDTFVCSKCAPCRGCYQVDTTFGSHPQPLPPTLSFPDNESLVLCSMCVKSYEKRQYCPNCAHSWDDDHFQQVQRQIRWQQAHLPKKRGRKRKYEDADTAGDYHSFTAPATLPNDDPIPAIAQVNPTWYHPETSQWGYTEVDMMTCDSCKLWVHAGCAGVGEEEYEQTSNGDHPIYSKEFLCRVCCRKRCMDIIHKLQQEDSMFLFAEPVTDKVAHNYHDVIKKPMDLQTMLARAEREDYLNYAWVRELFELMVLNALTFNRYHSTFWNEAKRYHKACLQNVWMTLGKGAPPSAYEEAIQNNFEKASEVKQMEDSRVQEDNTAEKKDLVAGSKVATITLPELREHPADQASCVPCREIKLKSADAYYSCWMDSCFVCGSSGASDTMLFCVDCGEGFHSFCVNAPIHSMDAAAVAGWRCPNCKICEISGEDPQDELKTLFCEMCDRGFSLDLLDPPISTAPSGLWICGQCVDCQKCHNKLEPDGPSLKNWSRDPQLCYRCGGCDGVEVENKRSRKCTVVKKHAGEITRAHMFQDACRVVQDGVLPCGDSCSAVELQEKLMEQIDWKTRNLWRDEYRKVVIEGVRFLQQAKEQFGDPRYLMDRFWQENVDLPAWMGQRATRFIHIAKKLKLETLGFSARRIEFCVLISKLAASWLKVACRTLGLKTKKHVKGYDRVSKLLTPPHESGTVELAFDDIRCERNRNIVNKDEWIERFEPELRSVVERHVFGHDGVEVLDETHVAPSSNGRDTHIARPAKPLCGWNNLVDESDYVNKWEDTRECCLCHLCGDDDAGLADQAYDDEDDSGRPAMPHLGRLLPMGDGLWVHSSCALWSSETWEEESGGQINAMEKARSRGSQLRCFGCGRPGATVGCGKTNCPCNYHFACAYACGAVFTSSKQMYCSQHRDTTEDVVSDPSFELMKTLVIAPDKAKANLDKEGNESEGSISQRVGALVVHSIGEIEQELDGFHTEDYVMPPGYTATRIFWSTVQPRTRIVYVLKIEKTSSGKPLFSITPADNPSAKMKSHSVTTVYNQLLEKVKDINYEYFSHGNMYSKLPAARLSNKKAFGLNGPQFFGFGVNVIRNLIEHSPGVEAVATPITEASPQYRFCYLQPSEEAIVDIQRRRAAADAEKKLENSSGCARTEGMTAVTRAGGSDRITRALVRSADNLSDVAAITKSKVESEQAKADRSRNQAKYKEMKASPIEDRLASKRSHIHGWGLFTKMELPKDSMIVEYMGEIVFRCVADKREKEYEISGEGSCYMFRLDLERIVDATKVGCMARFMNHSCQPNAYAKIITVDTDYGQDKKIMIFSSRDIKAGEEITYDYKFQVEDGSLKCTCGAPNCTGRMN